MVNVSCSADRPVGNDQQRLTAEMYRSVVRDIVLPYSGALLAGPVEFSRRDHLRRLSATATDERVRIRSASAATRLLSGCTISR